MSPSELYQMIPPSDSIGKMIQNLCSWDCKSGSIRTVSNDPRLLSSAAKHATKNVNVFLVDWLYAAKIS